MHSLSIFYSYENHHWFTDSTRVNTVKGMLSAAVRYSHCLRSTVQSHLSGDTHLYTFLTVTETSEQMHRYSQCCQRSGRVAPLGTSRDAFSHAVYSPGKNPTLLKQKLLAKSYWHYVFFLRKLQKNDFFSSERDVNLLLYNHVSYVKDSFCAKYKKIN